MTAFFGKGVEYEVPTLFKATRLEWAHSFIEEGKIYFTDIREFISEQDKQRGDPNEGCGVYIRNGVRCTIDDTNPIFVWCSTMETNIETIRNTWRDRD